MSATAVMQYLRDTRAWIDGPRRVAAHVTRYWIVDNSQGQWWEEKNRKWYATSQLFNHQGDPLSELMIEVDVPDWFTENLPKANL